MQVSNDDSAEDQQQIPYIIGVILLIGSLVGSLILNHKTVNFPTMSDGIYAGALFDEVSHIKRKIFLSYLNKTFELYISTKENKFQKIVIDKLSPLEFKLENQDFSLIGNASSEKLFEGSDKNFSNITWQLQKVISNNESVKNSINTIKLRREALKILEVEKVSFNVSELNKEKQKLIKIKDAYESLFSGGKLSTEDIEQKFNNEKKELVQDEETVKKLENEIAKLRSKVNLAKRNTEEGQLVIAARRSLKQELKKLEGLLS